MKCSHGKSELLYTCENIFWNGEIDCDNQKNVCFFPIFWCWLFRFWWSSRRSFFAAQRICHIPNCITPLKKIHCSRIISKPCGVQAITSRHRACIFGKVLQIFFVRLVWLNKKLVFHRKTLWNNTWYAFWRNKTENLIFEKWFSGINLFFSKKLNICYWQRGKNRV